MSITSVRSPGAVDTGLRERASRVIPGGMYGHLATAQLGPEYPQFMSRGSGAKVWDVDGREFIDLMCAFGPILLGYANAEVDAVAAQRSAAGDVLDTPGSEIVELAELLTQEVDHADWAMFAKNGSDATNLAVVVARAHTGRSKLLAAERAYHGNGGWAQPATSAGTAQAERDNTIYFTYNDLESVRAAVTSAGAEEIAAIVCTPHRQEVFADQDPVDPEFASGVRAICDEIGALLILDEVRCGPRIDLRGSWSVLGVRPDLSAWSKSLANGYPLSALLGSEPVRAAAARVPLTGSFWFAAAPMAAAIKTLQILKDSDGAAQMLRSGTRLQAGLREQARAHGLSVRVSGPPQMPLMLFDDDPEFKKSLKWGAACAANGVYLIPIHNWFISAAMTAGLVEQALERIDVAFAEVKAEFGAD